MHASAATHQPTSAPAVRTFTRPQRVLSVDVLRGVTIALMILVNDPGDWPHTYSQLEHSTWNGFTVTDFVFPNFLFLVGFSLILSLSSRIARSAAGVLDSKLRRSLALQMLRRSVILFAIHLSFSLIPPFHWTRVRLFGVLPRIAVCYLIAGLLCLAVWNRRYRARTLAITAASLLIGYWVLMRFVPVPGIGVPTHGVPILDPNRNLAAWLDRGFNGLTHRYLHTGSLYGRTFDPEGLLSTVPSIASTLIGCITALYFRRAIPIGESGVLQPHWLRQRFRYFSGAATDVQHTIAGLLLGGVFSLIAGRIWNLYFPINKNLWTSSYVLYSAGWSLVLLALCCWLIDIRRLDQHRAGKWAVWPWLVFGSNAITAFVFSNYFAELLLRVRIPSGTLAGRLHNPRVSLWGWAYLRLFARHTSTEAASLAFALVFTAICFIPNAVLWRRKIFLRI